MMGNLSDFFWSPQGAKYLYNLRFSGTEPVCDEPLPPISVSVIHSIVTFRQWGIFVNAFISCRLRVTSWNTWEYWGRWSRRKPSTAYTVSPTAHHSLRINVSRLSMFTSHFFLSFPRRHVVSDRSFPDSVRGGVCAGVRDVGDERYHTMGIVSKPGSGLDLRLRHRPNPHRRSSCFILRLRLRPLHPSTVFSHSLFFNFFKS